MLFNSTRDTLSKAIQNRDSRTKHGMYVCLALLQNLAILASPAFCAAVLGYLACLLPIGFESYRYLFVIGFLGLVCFFATIFTGGTIVIIVMELIWFIYDCFAGAEHEPDDRPSSGQDIP